MNEPIVPGSVRGPQTDKGLWPDLFDWERNSEGENLFKPKAGFRFKEKTPYALVMRQALFAVPTGLVYTPIAWDSIREDNYDAFGVNTPVYQVPVEGLYTIQAAILFEATAWVVGQIIWLQIRNATRNFPVVIDRQTVLSATAYHWGARGGVTIPCSKNDRVQLEIMHSNAGTKNLLGANPDFTFMSIVKVGDL